MNQQDDKIARAVATCLTYAAGTKEPLEVADDLFILLKISTGWTDAEISKVQSRVQSCLMRRRSSDRRPEPSPEATGGDVVTVQPQPPFVGKERRRTTKRKST
jgi:hypothetical protein